MNWWQEIPALLAEGDLVLVTVVASQGSAPRDGGTSMLVSNDKAIDTIGGGHLEWEAITHSRQLIGGDQAVELKRFSLAASLGQCCGGVVWVLFEKICKEELDVWKLRVEGLRHGKSLTRSLSQGDRASSFALVEHERAHCQLSGLQTEDLPASSRGVIGAWQLKQSVDGPTLSITIFGAGHVGMAIARMLGPLDAKVRLVDSREDLLAQAPSNVECVVTEDADEAVEGSPLGTYFLVLTHNHALDLELTYHILKRGNFSWFGLIGSKTKRAKFEGRLVERGIAPEDLQKICCPIGIAGIRSKEPQAIAVAVVAQLLQLWELQNPPS
jgi:xanthine dehydrogenase accessory factor